MNELLAVIDGLGGCAWTDWAPATLHFCEAHRCERIVAPAETWSNLAYFLVGGWLLFRSCRTSGRVSLKDIQTRMGLYALIVGVCSSLFHASYTYVFETADLAAMNFLGIEMVFQAMRRLGWFKDRTPVVFFLSLFSGALVLLFATKGADRLFVFGAFVVAILWLEALVFVRERRERGAAISRGLVWTLCLFLAAYAFWILDYTGLVCAPNRHWFSGHAAWHVLNSGCFLTLSAFYRSR